MNNFMLKFRKKHYSFSCEKTWFHIQKLGLTFTSGMIAIEKLQKCQKNGGIKMYHEPGLWDQTKNY